MRRLEQHVLLQPDATLAELLERSGVKVSVVCVHNTLKKPRFWGSLDFRFAVFQCETPLRSLETGEARETL